MTKPLSRRNAAGTAVEHRAVDTIGAATASVVIPGLGQALQHRYVTAALHLGSVAAYMTAALRFGGRGWALGALAFNAWSVIDAIWWSRRSGVEAADDLR